MVGDNLKLSKRSLYLIIASIYIITLFLGVHTFFNIKIIDQIRTISLVLLPFSICCSIIFDNYKKFDLNKIKKVPVIISIVTLIWFGLTMFIGIRTGIETIKGFIHFFTFILLGLLLFNCHMEKEDTKKIKKAFLISFMICLIIGILQYVFSIELNTFSNDKYPGIKGRINSTFYIATLLDKYIVLMFSVVTYELLKNKDNLFLKILLVLGTIGMTLTFSRSGQIVFLFVSFMFIIASLIKKHFKNVLLMIVSLLIMILIPGAKYSVQSGLNYVYETLHIPEVIQLDLLDILGTNDKVISSNKECKFDCFNDDVDGSEFFRNYYKSVGNQFIKEYPIFGVGIGNTSFLYNNQNAKEYLKDDSVIRNEYGYMYPHNGFIQVAAETGLIGLILLLSIYIVMPFYTITKENKQMLYIIGMLLVSFILGNETEGLFHAKQYIYLFVILYSTYCNISTKEKNELK